ncbi:MAG: hypothetical protein PHT07_15500 [Paludibacter sp.]|nr:hypothetical protein [Paludibacter sp.]
MTKAEIEIVKQAINDLMSENDYNGAIARLCRLVGWVYPAGEIPGDIKKISLEDFRKLNPNNCEFKAPNYENDKK